MWRIAFALAVVACGSRTPGPQLGSTHGAPPDAPVAATPDAPPEPPKPPPLDRDLPKLAEQAVKLFEEIVKAFDAAGTDCAAAAQRLDALRATYGEVSVANAKVLRDGRAKELREALAPYDERFNAAAKAIAGSKTMHACAMDATFAHAFDELVGSPP